jgi:hypothetical protein
VRHEGTKHAERVCGWVGGWVRERERERQREREAERERERARERECGHETRSLRLRASISYWIFILVYTTMYTYYIPPVYYCVPLL